MSKKLWLIKAKHSNLDGIQDTVAKNSDFFLSGLNLNTLSTDLIFHRLSSPIIFVEFEKDLTEHDEIIHTIKEKKPKAKIIACSQNESKDLFLKLIELKVDDYANYPLSISTVSNMAYKHSVIIKRTARRGGDPYFSKSKVVNELIKTIDQISSTEINCLFTGPSGSGKEFFAKYFKSKSPRSNAPFITVNCPAIPENLLESELFGHEKGSFTGAEEKKIGKIELAQGGILFLDEIGDLPLHAQTKLLRVIQEKLVEPVGSTKKIPVDFVLLSATSKNIQKEIENDRFRADLYYRIADIELVVPSLKDRIEDLDHLSQLFLTEFSKEIKLEEKRINAEALNILKHHPWPGNIRELKSVLKKLLLLSTGKRITKEDVTKQVPTLSNIIVMDHNFNTNISKIESKNLKIEDSEKSIIGEAIIKSKGNLSKAAQMIGLSRSTLYRKIKKYDIKYVA